ncbi:MAG: carbohydrate binding family 9 domain-containing protein [Gemmatimonadetes bacterium]|nr:carbohydrate binding family 9 domain-containing protein [Gemmatimonadota bacterium]
MRWFLALGTATLVAIPTVQAQEGQATQHDGQLPATELQAAQAMRAAGQIPVVDGRLDDSVWQDVIPITDFRQKNPTEGAPASEKTEVRFLYTDHDLFIAVRAFDSDPERMFSPLVRRDQEVNSDYVAIALDTYHDRRTAYQFIVNASGSRRDLFIYDDGARRDDTWDPVYDWATATDPSGWSAELRIPFSQLRFAHADRNNFGLRITRFINRKSEESNWPFVPRDQAGEVSHYGELVGLAALPSPRRVELLPYTAGSRRLAPTVAGNPLSGSQSEMRYGGDLKLGLTSGITMDVTFLPDFGQVEADPAVVNLSGFESFFPEKRPFFVEGTDLMRLTFATGVFGDEGLVYTRRIGRDPQLSPDVGSNYLKSPTETTILGAAKITGQLGKGWALGATQALTSKENGRLVTPTGGAAGAAAVEPFTSYSVVRLQRTVARGRITYGGIVTGVFRNLDDTAFQVLHRNAMSGGLDLRGRFGGDAYEFESKLLGTRVAGTRDALLRTQLSTAHAFQRPDQTYFTLDSNRTSLAGFAAHVRLAKVQGFFTWYGRYTTRSPGLEPNDIGFLRRGDIHNAEAGTTLRWLKPGPVFRRAELRLRQDIQSTYGWELGNTTTEARFEATFNNYWSFDQNAEWEPAHVDTRVLRGGPGVNVPAHYHFNGGVNSDPRRAVTGNVDWRTTVEDESGRKELTLSGGITYRPPGPVSINVALRRQWGLDDRQYLLGETVGANDYYVLGRMKRREVNLTLRSDIAMSPRLSLQLYAQPFASGRNFDQIRLVSNPRGGEYNAQFDLLGPDRLTRPGGSADATIDLNRDGIVDLSFSEPNRRVVSLRTNAVLRWEFRPGSSLYLVWNQNRADELYTGDLHTLENLGDSFGATGSHVFAIKVAYWIGL